MKVIIDKSEVNFFIIYIHIFIKPYKNSGLWEYGKDVCDIVSYKEILSRYIPIPRSFLSSLSEKRVIIDLNVCFSPVSDQLRL